jgi:dUTP pyrophosphatase
MDNLIVNSEMCFTGTLSALPNIPKITMDVKVTDEKFLPKFEDEGSIGMDLQSTINVTIPPKSKRIIPTGTWIDLSSINIRLNPWEELYADVRSRSGLARKHDLFVLNSPGTIDESYRGEIQVVLFNLGESEYIVSIGDRIAQLVISTGIKPDKLVIKKQLSPSSRGEKGFGSTGK